MLESSFDLVARLHNSKRTIRLFRNDYYGDNEYNHGFFAQVTWWNNGNVRRLTSYRVTWASVDRIVALVKRST